MRNTRWLLMLILLLGISAAGYAQTNCSAPNAGFTVVHFGNLYVAVWYPTAATPASFSYDSQISGSVAYNAPVSSCARYSLLLFSHAYGACATQSVFLTEQLAREGYIVIAPNYSDAGCPVPDTPAPDPKIRIPDTSFRNPATWNDQSALFRYQESETALNGILTHSQFSPQINPNRIAGFGHSLGGYTIFAMMGGWSSWYDSRIKIGVLLSPYMGPFVLSNPSTIPNVQAPIMYQTGTLDRDSSYIADPDQSYDQANTPKFLVELRDGSHADFSNVVCGLAPSTVADCLATRPNAALIDNYSAAFFNHYLNQSLPLLLWQTNRDLAEYKNDSETTVSSASLHPGVPVAPGELVTLFSEAMTTSPAQTAPSGNSLPTTLDGLNVTLTDANGTARSAQMYYASGNVVSYVVPSGTAVGSGTVAVSNAGNTVASGPVGITLYSPSLFSATGVPGGVAKGWAEVISGSGPPINEDIYNPATQKAIPIDVSQGNTYLFLLGTGLRNGANQALSATIGTFPVPVVGITIDSPDIGVDYVELGPIPPSLAGSGSVNVTVTEGRTASNAVSVLIQ